MDRRKKVLWQWIVIIGSVILYWGSAQTITTVQVQAYMQGFWNGSIHLPVPIAVELRSGAQLQTSTLVDRKAVMLSTTGTATALFQNLNSGNYWIVVRCGSHLPVASSTAVAISSGATISWDFRNPANVYNGNFALVQVGNSYALRAADANNDQGVNITDVLQVLQNNGLNNPGQVPEP